jgi:predicted transcriptional regulator
MEYSVAEILFEFGSKDRLRILAEIRSNPLKQGQLAEKLSVTIQEISRQCARLEEIGLIERHVDASYGLTSIGKVSLDLLPSFQFLNSEKEYFRSHDAPPLPRIFLERIGELSDHERLDHIDDALKFQSRIVSEGKSHVYFMSDRAVGHSFHEDHSNFSKGATLRLILPKSSVDTDVFRGARNAMGSRFQIGFIDEVRIVLALNEKMGAVSFPTLDGRPDYTRGFVGENPSFVGWCMDLFSYYWDKSMKKYPTDD